MSIQEKPTQPSQTAPEIAATSNPIAGNFPLRKFAVSIQPGRNEYRIIHNLETADVIVQTRIAGRIREGGVSIVDQNTVQLIFGGVLNEAMEIVIIG